MHSKWHIICIYIYIHNSPLFLYACAHEEMLYCKCNSKKKRVNIKFSEMEMYWQHKKPGDKQEITICIYMYLHSLLHTCTWHVDLTPSLSQLCLLLGMWDEDLFFFWRRNQENEQSEVYFQSKPPQHTSSMRYIYTCTCIHVYIHVCTCTCTNNDYVHLYTVTYPFIIP